MQDFKLTNNSFCATFFYGHDFDEGEDRLCWTMAGLNKLTALGLWKREFDTRGNLKSKPLTVEAAMKLARPTAATFDHLTRSRLNPDFGWTSGPAIKAIIEP